jgi:hypothetical protein
MAELEPPPTRPSLRPSVAVQVKREWNGSMRGGSRSDEVAQPADAAGALRNGATAQAARPVELTQGPAASRIARTGLTQRRVTLAP